MRGRRGSLGGFVSWEFGRGRGEGVGPSRASISTRVARTRVKLAGSSGAPGFIGTSTAQTRDNGLRKRISMSLPRDSLRLSSLLLWLIVLLCGF